MVTADELHSMEEVNKAQGSQGPCLASHSLGSCGLCCLAMKHFGKGLCVRLPTTPSSFCSFYLGPGD